MPDGTIALIGYGHWGRNLARNFVALNALELICEKHPDRLAEARAALPRIRTEESYEVVLQNPKIKAVVIATPATTHGEFVRKALDAGKHVYVEKPLCLDIEEAQALGRKANDEGLVLMVGHLLLYHGAFRALRNLVASGRLGRLQYIYSNRLNLGRIRTEENALWSFAPHDISMVLALTEKMPIRVLATGGQYLSPGVADTTLSVLHFEDNVLAHIFVSWLHPYKDQRLVVIGEKGMAVFNDTATDGAKLVLYRHSVGWNDAIPTWQKADAETVAYETAEPLRVECQAFLDAIWNRAQPPSDAEEGVRVLKVLSACQDSLTGGGYPVEL